MGPSPLSQPDHPYGLRRIGIIAALPAEASCLAGCKVTPDDPFPVSNELLLLVTGTGADRARKGAIKLLEFEVRSLLSWGVAGALDVSLQAGDVVLPETVIQTNGMFFTNTEWRQRIYMYMRKNNFKVSSGALVQADTILASPEAKARLHQTSGAVASDLESAAIAAVACDANIDYMAIRAISDDASTAIPDVVIKHTNHHGQPILPDFIFDLLRNPYQIIPLFRLAQGYKEAKASLRRLAQTIPEALL